MKHEERIRKLAALARIEAPPRVHVADRVMARLRAGREVVANDIRPLAYVGALSAAAAAVVTLMAFSAQETWSDVLTAAVTDIPRWWL
jgi:hypothetical protein